MGTSVRHPLARSGYRVTALVLSRIKRQDIRTAMSELEAMSRPRAYLRIFAVIAGLFALALLAASFGWPGLAVYFVAIVLIFR